LAEGERKNMKQDTLEGRAKTKNGVKRLCFSAVCILLEAAFIIAMITKLNQYAEIINLMTRLLAGVLVLKLYASDQTSSMKMPWVILILVFPIMGVGLYLLIGLNGGTLKMRERYAQIDRELLPLLPNDSECRETLGRKIPKAGNIADYIQRNASYPVYQNTDVIYYDEAVKGLEAQLEDLAKAEKFIFMEYHAIEDAQAWHKIQSVLEDRVKAGVDVRVFYDDMGSIGFINTDFIKKMEKVGIHCRVFNPFTPGLNVFLNNRDHRKITVIDGKVGFTGGYNLANEYFNFTHPYGQWKDTGIRLEGEAVRSLTVTFLEMWNAVSDKDKNDRIEKNRCIKNYN
jgi:cardiolipin synthase